jgi:hypothetical protein
MADYRVFLRDQDGTIIGRDDFDAPDDLRAMFIARALCDACSDRAASCELRQGFRVVDKRFPMRTVNLSAEYLASTTRKIIFERQIALLKSRWAIADSPRLREQTARLLLAERQIARL